MASPNSCINYTFVSMSLQGPPQYELLWSNIFWMLPKSMIICSLPNKPCTFQCLHFCSFLYGPSFPVLKNAILPNMPFFQSYIQFHLFRIIFPNFPQINLASPTFDSPPAQMLYFPYGTFLSLPSCYGTSHILTSLKFLR